MIEVVMVKDKTEGNMKARELLKQKVDGQTLLALSGGASVDYRKMITSYGNVIPGAICVVDERFGKPFHKDSNEKLLADFGVKEYADEYCIESHKYLKDKSFLETAQQYEKEIQALFGKFKKRVGVMGIGTNLHTAGIFPYSAAVDSQDFVQSQRVEDKFPERLTLTLRALGEFTCFLILMFGETKREAINILLNKNENDIQKYPAIFYRKSKVKSYLITDCEVS